MYGKDLKTLGVGILSCTGRSHELQYRYRWMAKRKAFLLSVPTMPMSTLTAFASNLPAFGFSAIVLSQCNGHDERDFLRATFYLSSICQVFSRCPLFSPKKKLLFSSLASFLCFFLATLFSTNSIHSFALWLGSYSQHEVLLHCHGFGRYHCRFRSSKETPSRCFRSSSHRNRYLG